MNTTRMDGMVRKGWPLSRRVWARDENNVQHTIHLCFMEAKHPIDYMIVIEALSTSTVTE